MKTRLFIIILFVNTLSLAQQDDTVFIDFLNNDPRSSCLAPLDSLALEHLFRSKVIRIKNHNVTLNKINDATITIDPFGLCNEYRAITYRFHKIRGNEYMFVYKKFAEAREEYGELQLYEKIDGSWEFGRTLTFDWKHFFSISQEEIDRLRNLNQYPTYLVTFRERGIEFSIPWEIYSFDQGSEINGYVKGHGSQPILLEYDDIIR